MIDRRRQSLALVGAGLLLLSLVALLFVPLEKAVWGDNFVQRCGALVGYQTEQDVAVSGNPHPAYFVLVQRQEALCSDAIAARKLYVLITAAALLVALSLLWIRSRALRIAAKLALGVCSAALWAAAVFDGPVLILLGGAVGGVLSLAGSRRPSTATTPASVALEA